MIGRAAQGAAVLLASLVLATACSSSNRPEDLSLSEAKPCQLILHSKFQALNISRGPTLSDTAGGYGLEGSSCDYSVRYETPRPPISVFTSNTVTLSVITNHGVDEQIDGAADDASDEYKDVPPIEGYRAVRVWNVAHPPGPNTSCELYVDVADEQMLRVYLPKSRGEGDPPTCQTARQFAKEALKTLRTRQG